MFAAARKQSGEAGRHYPAVAAALRADRGGLPGSRAAGFAAERDEFAKVVFTPPPAT